MMSQFFQKMIWFCIAAGMVGYASYLVIGSFLYATESRSDAPIVVQDRVKANEHTLSGIVVLPSTCEQLKGSLKKSETTEDLYVINLETWDTPSVKCGSEPVARIFQVQAFAPAVGVRFIAQLDGVPFPITVTTVHD